MSSFRNGKAAVLLLALTQSLVFASLDNENSNHQMMASLLQRSWIDGIDSVPRVSETCADEVTALVQATAAGDQWALNMLDASSKLQSGILKGNLRDLGMYEQCIEASGQYNGTNVQGKHCTVTASILSSAVCVPSSCNETDVEEIISAAIQNVSENIGLELDMIEISGVSCVPTGSEAFSTGEILTIFFFSTVFAFIVFCTICEFVKIYRPRRVSPIINELAKFSLYKNAMATLSTKISPQMMPAIQGLRVISTCWVVLGHRYLYALYRPMVNSLYILEWYNSWTAVYIQAAPFAVDTFFVISGFVMCYFFLKSKQSGKRSNFPMMYLHRYLRLTPALAVLMLFVAVLLHRVSNGPIWDGLLTTYVDNCRKNWWVNFLYVQNFVNVTEMCLSHSWYLAVDMQLFWISPIILYPLHRWPKYGLGMLCMLLIASVVTPAVVLVVNEYSNAVLWLDGKTDDMTFNFRNFYIPTYNRACAYFVGVLLGYDAAKGKRHLSQVNVAINWVVTCILIVICILSTQRIYNTTFEYDIILEAAFALLLRPFWSISMAWIVYACCFGYGGVVTRFLSLPIFLPLSRLSYCIYLMHLIIQGITVFSAQTPGRFANFLMVNDFWADLVMSIAAGFVFSLFFESPIIVLEKMLSDGGRKRGPAPKLKDNVEGGIDNKGMNGT